jgi:hypothetical protein
MHFENWSADWCSGEGELILKGEKRMAGMDCALRYSLSVEMEHVRQLHPLGCFIAAAAMVLDMTYDEVAAVMPLQDMDVLRNTGQNKLGIYGWRNLHILAKERGKAIVDFTSKPFVRKPGLRYLGMLATPDPLLTHIVAIDEDGIVFDPDPNNEKSRKSWLEYDFMAMAEFRSTVSSG